MEHRDEALKELAKIGLFVRTRVEDAIKEILRLVEPYKALAGTFTFSSDPELDAKVNAVLIALSDDCLKKARSASRTVLDNLKADIDEDTIIEEQEDEGEDEGKGLLWAFDMHSSNLKRLLEAWIAIWFANDLARMDAYSQIISYMNAPDASRMWRDSIRARLVDPNEVKFGRGYQRNIPNALTITLQTFIYGVFMIGAIEAAEQRGALYYRTVRGSSYDCPFCDEECEVVRPISEPFTGYHPRCMCYPVFLKSEDPNDVL